MTKIGTVHVEVKPTPNLDAWEEVCQRLEDRIAEAVARGVERGMAAANKPAEFVIRRSLDSLGTAGDH